MNSVILLILLVPIIEIYLFIKIGSQIGAFNTISLIFITAIVGLYYAKYEGLNTLKSAIKQIVGNEIPAMLGTCCIQQHADTCFGAFAV